MQHLEVSSVVQRQMVNMLTVYRRYKMTFGPLYTSDVGS